MRKRIVVIMLMISLIIIYHTSAYATAYGGTGSSETAYGGGQTTTTTTKPVQNPHSSETTTSGTKVGPSSSMYTTTGSEATGQSPYSGPYGSDTGNIPNNPASTGSSTGTLGESGASPSHTPDEIIKEAESFLQQGSKNPTISGEHLEKASSTLYNLLLSIGIFLAVAIGMYLGVKFMMSSVEDKAKVKEALVPYIAGCVVIFTGFAIWRIVILLIRGIA